MTPNLVFLQRMFEGEGLAAFIARLFKDKLGSETKDKRGNDDGLDERLKVQYVPNEI